MAERSALNLSYQDRMPATGKPERLLTVRGTDLLGLPVKVCVGGGCCAGWVRVGGCRALRQAICRKSWGGGLT